MGILDSIKRFLRNKSDEEIKDFEDILFKKYGINRYLYSTSEGLPIMGNFEKNDELSARIPETFKILSGIAYSNMYIVKSEDNTYLLLRVTPEVLLLAQLSKELSPREIMEVAELTKSNLGI